MLSYSGFFVLQKGTPATFKTEFRLAHDGQKLYVAAHCFQKSDQFFVISSGRDGRVWSDDSVEFLLNKPQTKGPKDYFQVILNTENPPNLFDMLNGDWNWNCGVEAASQRQPSEGWTIEFAVPLKEIAMDPARDRFLKMNMVRNVMARANEYAEISNWFPTYYANGDLESRGWLVLE